MKIERMAINKIKVTLSSDDMREWGISAESLSHNSPEVQNLFWTLIRRAEAETGFSADNSQLVVEAMPAKNDGFIMIITRVCEDDENSALQKYVRPKVKKDSRTKKKRAIDGTLLFELDRFDDVVAACKFIRSRFSGASSLYEFGGSYYLYFDATNEFVADDLDITMTEYARRDPYGAIKAGVLEERGQLLISGDAVTRICEAF